MIWQYWLFLAIAVAALAAIFYFAMRDDVRLPTAPKGKEPFFGNKSAAGKSSQESPQELLSQKSSQESLSQESSPELVADDVLQRSLPMQDFVPPPLPLPPESLLPLDMCYSVWFYGEKNTAAKEVEELRKSLRPGKSSYCLGFDEQVEQWRLSPDIASRYWIVATPLADRGGAITDADIRGMEENARSFAQKTKMHSVFPRAFEILEDAARIDRFCATVDMFIELRLGGDRQSAARIGEVMRLAGMSGDGRDYVYRMNSEDLFCGRVMPSPANGLRQTIIFELDAPNISAPVRAFSEMLTTARRVAQMLNMQLTDPQGAPIGDERVTDLSKQLALLTSQMCEFGAVPGGAVARLIFS